MTDSDVKFKRNDLVVVISSWNTKDLGLIGRVHKTDPDDWIKVSFDGDRPVRFGSDQLLHLRGKEIPDPLPPEVKRLVVTYHLPEEKIDDLKHSLRARALFHDVFLERISVEEVE